MPQSQSMMMFRSTTQSRASTQRKTAPRPSRVRPLDADEHVVADRPALGVHDVDPADVVAAEIVRPVGLVVVELLGPVVVEQAVLHAAVGGAEPLAVFLGHRHPLDAPLPNVVDHAVVDRHATDAAVRVELEAVPLDVLDRQVGDRHAGAAGDADQLAQAALAVEDHAVALARLAAERDVVGVQLEIPRQPIMPVGHEDRAAGLDLLGRRIQLVHARHADDRPGRLGQRRGFGETTAGPVVRRPWLPNRSRGEKCRTETPTSRLFA